MFNNQWRILITNVPNGMWEERGRVNLHAHNPNPQAPEHLSMVNNLTQRLVSSHTAAQERNMAILMSRSRREQFLTALHLESLTR